jgi:hypothetical protein
MTLTANIDGAPGDEIVVSGHRERPDLRVKGDGTFALGFPLDRAGRRYHIGRFSAGNLIADAALELAGSVADDSTNIPSDTILPDPLEAYSGNGVMLPGWPRTTTNYISQAPTLVDVDGDGFDELYLGAENYYLYGLRPDGGPVPGFALQPSLQGSQSIMSPLAGDLDADGHAELVLIPTTFTQDPKHPGRDQPGHGDRGETRVPARQTQRRSARSRRRRRRRNQRDRHRPDRELPSGEQVGVIRVLRPDGTLVREFRYSNDPRAIAGMALADLDQDGVPEIVLSLSQFDSFYQTTLNEVTALKGNGQVLAGWPKVLDAASHYPAAVGAVVVGDVDGDLLPEVIADVTARCTSSTTTEHRDGQPEEAARHPHLQPDLPARARPCRRRR